jgi:hypothetical protein
MEGTREANHCGAGCCERGLAVLPWGPVAISNDAMLQPGQRPGHGTAPGTGQRHLPRWEGLWPERECYSFDVDQRWLAG